MIPKQAKTWHLMQNNRLCVEEPFNTDRNLGNTADDISFRGVHLELRRAFDLVSQAKLDECCEQFVFPPSEEKIWSKPPPQPRPVLTRSLSQSGRSGKAGSMAGKGNHPNQKHRAGASSRRASSAASSNKAQIHSTGQHGAHPAANDRLHGNDIHEQLYHHYQLLQAQEAQLRLQMHQRTQANLHAQITAQLQPLQMPSNVYQQQPAGEGPRAPTSVDPAPLTAPLRTLQGYYYSLQAHNQSVPMHTLTPSLPGSQSGTNPPSPSMTPVLPTHTDLRRSIRRSMANESNLSTMRSHSQPPESFRYQSQAARAIPVTQYNPNLQGQLLGFHSLQQYQQARPHVKYAAELHRPSDRSGESQYAGTLFVNSTDEPVPREYVGYYLDQSPQSYPGDSNAIVPPIPSYSDLVHRNRGVSPNLSKLRCRSSQSPSPSRGSESRDHSISFYSATSTTSPSQSGRASDNGPMPRSSGPVIVDGSSDSADFAISPRSTSFPTNHTSHAASVSGDKVSDTPILSPVLSVEEDADSPTTAPSAQRRMIGSLPSILQFGDFPLEAPIVTKHSRGIEASRASEKISPGLLQDGSQPIKPPNGLGIDITSAKPKEVIPPIPSSSQSSMPIPSTVAGLNLASSLKSLPLLSPVREVRTPSPTAARNSTSSTVDALKNASHGRSNSLSAETKPSPLGKSFTGSQNGKGKAVETVDQRSSSMVNGSGIRNPQQAPPPLPPITQQAQVSGWQQSTSKKSKKYKKAGSVGSAPLIVGEGERKGG